VLPHGNFSVLQRFLAVSPRPKESAMAVQQIVMLVLMFGIVYFVMIRPQTKRQREMQEMLKKLDKGDEVITRGGLIGKITGITAGDVLVIELQEKVRVRVPRSYVEGKWVAPASTSGETGAKAA
jgi:preprotein translocase subunit YajC